MSSNISNKNTAKYRASSWSLQMWRPRDVVGSGNLVCKAGMGWLLIPKNVWRDQHRLYILLSKYLSILYSELRYNKLKSQLAYHYSTYYTSNPPL